ncbi:MAG: hypothetical protein SNJ72_07080 [Fimbriimonadales bacterium]
MYNTSRALLWAGWIGAIVFTAGYALLNLFGLVPLPEWVQQRLEKSVGGAYPRTTSDDVAYIVAVLLYWFPYSFSGALVGIMLYYTTFIRRQSLLLRGVLLGFILAMTLLHAHFPKLSALASAQGLLKAVVLLLCTVCLYVMLRSLDRIREFVGAIWDAWHNRE